MGADRAAPARAPRPRTTTALAREILNAIFHVLRGGIAWRLLPSGLVPESTVFSWFGLWRDTGLGETINHLLVMADCERVGREASPTAAILDSHSVKTTESDGPRGYDSGKKVKGRKRQVMVDTDGRGPVLEPQPADVQDRDGTPGVLRLSPRSFPFIVTAFADSGYAGEAPAQAASILIEIVKKPPDQVGFAVHPRRWVVERFFAWISRNRRLWKDPEATLTSARAFLYAASVMLLVRRLGRHSRLRSGLLEDLRLQDLRHETVSQFFEYAQQDLRHL
jgi:transposase